MSKNDSLVTWVFNLTYANGHTQTCAWLSKKVRPSDATAQDMLSRYSNPNEGFAGYVTKVAFKNQKSGKTFEASRLAPSFLVF